MSLLSDHSIKKLCGRDPKGVRRWGRTVIEPLDGQPMITPFVDRQVRRSPKDKRIISYGLSSFGYDVSLKSGEGNVQLFTNINGSVIDPMGPEPKCYANAEILTNEDGFEYFIIPPSSYALGVTIERFHMPTNVSAICTGKSTLARSACAVTVTPIEAGFCGNVVIEIANLSNLPLMVYLEMGIAQFQFYQGDQVCETSYADRSGKYQHQSGLQKAIV